MHQNLDLFTLRRSRDGQSSSFPFLSLLSRGKEIVWVYETNYIEWIGEESEAFDEILSDRGDFRAFAGARGVATILEKIGCEHVKAATQTETVFTVDNMKDPSAEATLMGEKFYSNVWMKGGREIADEAIKKNEKETHEAREEAK